MTVGAAFVLGAGIGALIHPLIDLSALLLTGDSPFNPKETS